MKFKDISFISFAERDGRRWWTEREGEDGDVERAGDVESRGDEEAATRRRGVVVIGDDWW